MIELKFINSDARPKTQTIHCGTASIAPIMAWYGAYFAGDRYSVFVNGQKIAKDKNGEAHPEPPLPDAQLENGGACS